eukprot:CAMPEP_0113661734 /NCGR_PEP_ID=MMETSP0038_2-20120614/148_1 /TAXON_ID=2898 /ORGANISM="Cryptomonas paramecium" /LENGTH=128 /DNA_ID=CAMNT_0000576477 /DNA_START=131 /DNA_END=513 /DNA_ORIENTATION=+ /assembly_acc=CAM_ASM_000170
MTNLISADDYDLPAIEKRLEVEAAIQQTAKQLVKQIPIVAEYSANSNNGLTIERANDQAARKLRGLVQSLAKTSVQKHGEAVVDTTEADGAGKRSALHRRMAAMLSTRAALYREKAAEKSAEAAAAAR